ncbi:MAG TPA: hypothetical protein VHK91_10505 [Flavisolibacter sp.]|jgi:hypothetical protein|nr:hypothetical protein [Flavisolibacter sp.]
MATAGYSGTPLYKKLNYKEGQVVQVWNAPETYQDYLTGRPAVTLTNDLNLKKDLIHYFTTEVHQLKADLVLLKAQLKPDGMIWISWPKKASKVITDLTEDLIRELALAHGLIDVKVCAVDATWSALKLVIPVTKRNL